MFRKSCGTRRGGYREYVERGLAETDAELEELLRSGRGMIATEEFVRGVLGRVSGGDDPGGASYRSVLKPVSVLRVMEAVLEGLGVDRSYLARRRGSAWARGVAAEMLCTYAGLTQTAAARELGLGTGSSVSNRRKMLAEERVKDRSLDRRLNRIAKRLDALLNETWMDAATHCAQRMGIPIKI